VAAGLQSTPRTPAVRDLVLGVRITDGKDDLRTAAA
jgi:hypothetical protein